jgi:hypothetical protein
MQGKSTGVEEAGLSTNQSPMIKKVVIYVQGRNNKTVHQRPCLGVSKNMETKVRFSTFIKNLQ